MDFRTLYPLSVKGAVYNFIIWHDGDERLSVLPFPSLAGIRDFAYYAGASDAAIRTTLSRGKADGVLRSFKDEQGIARYRLAEPQLIIPMMKIHEKRMPEGFIIAVFSFTREASGERSLVREALRNFHFKKIAQNTYVNGRIDTGPLLKIMKELGLSDHLYLFTCPEIDDPALMKKILGLFDIARRHRELKKFHQKSISFLTEGGLDDREEGRRLFYAGLIHREKCLIDEPPIPAKCLPAGYPIQTINRFYDEYPNKNFDKMIRYYGEVNK